MDDIPSLDELLNYGEEYQYPDLIMSDYFRVDNTKTKENTNQQFNEEMSENSLEKQQTDELRQEDNFLEQTSNYIREEENLKEKQDDEVTQEDKLNEQQSDEDSEDKKSEESMEDNDFDNLLDNYEDSYRRDIQSQEEKEVHSASDKLNDITATKIYKVLKQLVSLSYERFQQGAYQYDKKKILQHYLTNQKFRILDDFVSPIFKPDVYVFDLSPSNNESLEMYVNAISSVAIKNSIIYLTYNDCILRKLLIKKQNAKNIDVRKIVDSDEKYYQNFECSIFNEYRSLYEELRKIRDRKIYIFSDFDISRDISKLSQENTSIVWFSTEKYYGTQNFFFREYPSSYQGYYVATSGIEDIEKFIGEKNKNKYKRRGK